MKALVRFVIIAAGNWALLAGLSRVVRISPGCPLWLSALIVAAAIEFISWLYRYESNAVTPRRSNLLVGLRLLALALLVWILLEPVWVRKVERETKREVVVVLDDSGSMHLQDDGQSATRIAIGEAALSKANIVAKLAEKMRVRVVRAARSVRADGTAAAAGWGDSTNLATALGTVLEQVPPDELAGVLMVSDGRHNRPERVEDVARRFGILDAPVGVIAVGHAEPPTDAAIISVRAPDAIHLGDRLRVSADLKIDGYRGQQVMVTLKRGDKLLEDREISIPQDHHREEIHFAQVPEQGGVGDYRVEISPLEGERFKDNNAWEFETSITDARTNVLIVEGYPRWEFRYLRNLFYGRDKSVHLQYVLQHPDAIEGQGDPALPASAARPFGDALATRMPENEDEWRKFDVIILGDIDPQAVDEATWKIISRCVNERSALLVMIAGPRFMPHAIDSTTGRSLVPVELDYGHRNYFNEGNDPFHCALTGVGKTHPVTQQGSGETSSEVIWQKFPSWTWRHPLLGLKDGAEVLLSADTADEKSVVTGSAGLASALDDLAKQREREAKSALLVTRSTGKGKVALLLTDRTWRLREGAGDIYHHRFWGNLVRWGAGPVLRSGGSRARLGTDQLTYSADDRAKVTARLRDKRLAPVTDTSLHSELLRDGKVLANVAMTAVDGSEGLYEANLDRLAIAGNYEVRLRGERADALIHEDAAGELKTSFRVVNALGPIELAETTLNLPLLETVAQLSGGKVVTPDTAADLTGLFLTAKNDRQEVRESSLWDNGWVLGLLAISLGGEWVARRTAGLP